MKLIDIEFRILPMLSPIFCYKIARVFKIASGIKSVIEGSGFNTYLYYPGELSTYPDAPSRSQLYNSLHALYNKQTLLLLNSE
jgi:hypothetical protein